MHIAIRDADITSNMFLQHAMLAATEMLEVFSSNAAQLSVAPRLLPTNPTIRLSYTQD
jgi:hypothetical protein